MTILPAGSRVGRLPAPERVECRLVQHREVGPQLHYGRLELTYVVRLYGIHIHDVGLNAHLYPVGNRRYRI